MKRITGVKALETGVGTRVIITYSELDADGNIVSDNLKKDFVAVDAGLLAHIEAIKAVAQARIDAE